MEAIVSFDGVGKKEQYEVRRSMVEVGEERRQNEKEGATTNQCEKSRERRT